MIKQSKQTPIPQNIPRGLPAARVSRVDRGRCAVASTRRRTAPDRGGLRNAWQVGEVGEVVGTPSTLASPQMTPAVEAGAAGT